MKLIKGTRPALWVNTAVAWSGVILTNTITLLGKADNKKPVEGLFGGLPEGTPGMALRGMQQLTYFTMWSNIMVAAVTLMLALNPQKRTPWRKALHMCALMMILVTAVVYAVAIAPTNPLRGWSLITNPWQHIGSLS